MNLEDSMPMHALRGLLATAVVCLSSLGCGNLLGPRDSGRLVATWDGEEIALENRGIRTVFYHAITAEMAALVLWAPCVDLDVCWHVRAGESARLGPEDVFGLEEGTSDVLIYWWVAVREGGERRPGRIHVINLPR